MICRHISIFYLLIVGFFLVFILFWVRPVFFSSSQMNLISMVPRMNTVGHDFQQVHRFATGWALEQRSPYVQLNPFPPLTTVLFTPLVFLNFQDAYILMTLLTLMAYTGLTLVLPMLILKKRSAFPLIVFLFATGLVSYGFQFELERGQFNVIALFFCFLGIYFFHYHSNLRYLAYAFFSLSVQLKLYPAIFVLAFLKNPRDWKRNFIRFFSLGICNILLLFALGWDIFLEYFSLIFTYFGNAYTWTGNHSIVSFVFVVQENLASSFKTPSFLLSVIQRALPFLETVILLILGLGLVLILMTMYKVQLSGCNPYLLMGCIIIACLLPSSSHDYKLSLLTGPTAIFLGSLHFRGERTMKQGATAVLVLLISISYSMTLIPFFNRPLIYQNSLPLLMVLFVTMVILMLLRESPRFLAQH